MRRLVVVVGAATGLLAALALWVVRSVPAVPGNLPGGAIASAINTWMNGPSYRVMAEALDPGPEDEVLDVACGDGAFLAEYASPARHVAGLDLYDVKVELARRRLADRIAAGTAEVVEGDAGALPWEGDRFSTVTCMDAFSFLPDPDGFLREVHRVLRPGGRAVMMLGAQVPEGGEPRVVLGHVMRKEAEVRPMVEAAGFDVTIAYRPMGGDNRLANSLCRLLMGTDQVRIVTALKPAAVQASKEAAAPEAIAVG
jgi:SAM-dependent methyltransferase